MEYPTHHLYTCTHLKACVYTRKYKWLMGYSMVYHLKALHNEYINLKNSQRLAAGFGGAVVSNITCHAGIPGPIHLGDTYHYVLSVLFYFIKNFRSKVQVSLLVRLLLLLLLLLFKALTGCWTYRAHCLLFWCC